VLPHWFGSLRASLKTFHAERTLEDDDSRFPP
jgi:hypothetical protein